MVAPTDSFWEFSCTLYERDGVAATLIDLQDRLGADVNVILYCCWTACTGRGPVPPDAFADLDEMLAPWRTHVTTRLRNIRRDIKEHAQLITCPGAQVIRDAVLSIEVQSERVSQDCLQASAPQITRAHVDVSERLEEARSSLLGYLEFLIGRRQLTLPASLDQLINSALCD